MNLSEWDLYEPITQRDLMDLIIEQIDEKEMPLWYYLWLHPKSKLSEADITVLRNWILADEDQTDGAGLTETQ
jgi:hypothetical protein